MADQAITRESVGSTNERSSCATIDGTFETDTNVLASEGQYIDNRDCSLFFHSHEWCDRHNDDEGDFEEITPTASGSLTGETTLGLKRTDQEGIAIDEHDRPPLRPQRGVVFHLRAWWHELAWCLLAIGLLIALVVVLRCYENKAAPKWPSELSLNTVVATIATMCRALTVIPISEGLSQLKWNSLSRTERPLRDLYTFDQASRGPWGSLMLIFRAQGRLLAISTFAAVVLVSGLATSSLTQAAISLASPPEQQVKEAIAKRAIDPLMQEFLIPNYMLDAAYSVILMRGEGRREKLLGQVETRCPVGDCRWESFTSLGVCGSAKDVTNRLEVRELSPEESRGNHSSFEDPDEYYSLSLYSMPFTVHDNNGNSPNALLASYTVPELKELPEFREYANEDFFSEAILARHDFIYKTPHRDKTSYRGDKSPYRAAQAAWYWCVQEYEVGVAAGVAYTDIVDTSLNIKETRGDNLTIKSANKMEKYEFQSLPLMLHSLDLDNETGSVPVLGTQLEFLLFSDPKENKPWPNPLHKLQELVGDMALGMSTTLRALEEDEKGTVLGYARVGDMVVIVRWPWLSLLAAQIAFTVVFLVYVMLDTARTGVEIVKSSNIAELLAIGKRKGDLESLLPGGIAAELDGNLKGRLLKEEGLWNLDVCRQLIADGK